MTYRQRMARRKAIAKATSRAHYLVNREEYLARAREWKRRNPDRVRAHRKRYSRTRWGRRVLREQQRRKRERRRTEARQ